MKLLLVVLLLAVPSCLLGCKASAPKDFNDAMLLLEKVQQIAERHNLSWSGDLDWSGRGELYWGSQAGLDTGLDVKIHLQGHTEQSP